MPQAVKGKFFSLEPDQSSNSYEFRGIKREINADYVQDYLNYRFNASVVGLQLHARGHEYKVGEGEEHSVLTSNFPFRSIDFATPEAGELGYLLIYDNRDIFFNNNNYFDWARSTPIHGPKATLRDRLELVVLIKNEESNKLQAKKGPKGSVRQFFSNLKKMLR